MGVRANDATPTFSHLNQHARACDFANPQNGEFCHHAVATDNLLLEAASLLESSQAMDVGLTQCQSLQSPQTQQIPLIHFSLSSSDGSSTAASPSHGSRVSASTELRSFFTLSGRVLKQQNLASVRLRVSLDP